MLHINYVHEPSHQNSMKKNCLLFLICLFVTFPVSVGADTVASTGNDGCQTSTVARWTVVPLIKVYQTYLSPFMITRCPSWPNCSHYASQAVKKHGAAMGAFMAVDRLFHEAGKVEQPPTVFVEGRGYLIYDPLDHNDFWWDEPSQEVNLPDIPQRKQK